MPVTLKTALAETRRYTVETEPGEQVTFLLAPLSFVGSRAIAAETGVGPDEVREAAAAGGLAAERRFAEIIARRLDAEIEIHGEGWEGVVGPDGEPLPLTPDNFRAFRDQYWRAADDLFRQITAAQQAVHDAGNPSGR